MSMDFFQIATEISVAVSVASYMQETAMLIPGTIVFYCSESSTAVVSIDVSVAAFGCCFGLLPSCSLMPSMSAVDIKTA